MGLVDKSGHLWSKLSGKYYIDTKENISHLQHLASGCFEDLEGDCTLEPSWLQENAESQQNRTTDVEQQKYVTVELSLKQLTKLRVQRNRALV